MRKCILNPFYVFRGISLPYRFLFIRRISLFRLDTDYIIANPHIIPDSVKISIVVRHPAYFALLTGIHRFQGMSHLLSASVFYFHKYQIFLVPANQVQFKMAVAPVRARIL